MFHQTGANYKNLHQRWYLSKLHRNEEARYILKSRKDFIKKSFSTLSEREVNILAEKTRGLNSTDINIAVENFLNKRFFQSQITLQIPANFLDIGLNALWNPKRLHLNAVSMALEQK